MDNQASLTRRNAIRSGALGTAATLGAAAEPVFAAEASSESIGWQGCRSICEFGVDPAGSGETNRKALQDAIDWASPRGAALFVDPSEEPYRVASGIRLRANTSLIGVHGPLPRGTSHPHKPQPVGSVFSIESTEQPFITVETATQLRGLQFWYPAQSYQDPAKIIEYPPTIQRAKDQPVWGVTLSSLSFFGEFRTFDFGGLTSPEDTNQPAASELILFEHCYGYPLSGRFIEIDYCYDIPRVLHCHVNPANRRAISKTGHSPKIIESVVDRKTFCYAIDHTDNAQLMDLFTFGVYGGIRLGAESYGQLTNFNLDCVTVGIHKSGSQQFNRNWQLSQGSIIANTGTRTADLHPIVLDGQGHTSISNVECFSGGNGAILKSPKAPFQGRDEILSDDFLLINGQDPLSASLFGCRMTRFAAENPINVRNSNATIATYGCFQSRGNIKSVEPYPDGIVRPV